MMALIVGRHEVVLSLTLEMSNGTLTLCLQPQGRLPPSEWNTTSLAKNGPQAPFRCCLPRHPAPDGQSTKGSFASRFLS